MQVINFVSLKFQVPTVNYLSHFNVSNTMQVELPALKVSTNGFKSSALAGSVGNRLDTFIDFRLQRCER